MEFIKEFFKLMSNLNNQNEKNIEKYKNFLFGIKKDILIEELNNNNKVDFLIKTQAYQRFDNYSGDWLVFIDLKNNYKDKFDKIFYEKISLVNESIILEKEILDFKLNNFDDYYIYKYNKELENKKMWKQTILESNGTVGVQGLNKKVVSKESLRNILEMQVNLLKNRNFSKSRKYIDDISFEFEFVTFHNTNVFYGFLLDIYDFLLNFDNFKKDFYLDYPIFEDKKYKKYGNYKFMNNLMKNRFTQDDNTNSFFLFSPVVESIKDIKRNILSLNKIKNKNNDETNYYSDEIDRLNKTLKYLSMKKTKGELIENSFLKDEKDSKAYILINENSKNLIKLIGYSLKDRFDLDNKIYEKIKKSKFELDIKFLTY